MRSLPSVIFCFGMASRVTDATSRPRRGLLGRLTGADWAAILPPTSTGRDQMGLLRRQPKTIHGIPTKDIARASHKDLRGMKAYLDPLLPAGEAIEHFVKSPAGDVHAGLRYIVITNQSVVECW